MRVHVDLNNLIIHEFKNNEQRIRMKNTKIKIIFSCQYEFILLQFNINFQATNH